MSVFKSFDKLSTRVRDISTDYVNNSTDYFKLKIFYHLTKSFTFGIKLLILFSILIGASIFLSVALVMWLGKALNSYPLACIIVAVIFIFVGLIAYVFRKKIDKKVIKTFSKDFFDESI
ncbi:phage holin family protein [Aureivirga sp. CE67]|uniref:phage holin family protein n=1 Tax=Aureivirga sp. CE67 TaxID=1788983 RepID=UPI0018C9A8FB|nr:phage holin family protein [Aureivirga sp. CE67]